MYYALYLIYMHVYFKLHWNIFNTFRSMQIKWDGKMRRTKCNGRTNGSCVMYFLPFISVYILSFIEISKTTTIIDPKPAYWQENRRYADKVGDILSTHIYMVSDYILICSMILKTPLNVIIHWFTTSSNAIKYLSSWYWYHLQKYFRIWQLW